MNDKFSKAIEALNLPRIDWKRYPKERWGDREWQKKKLVYFSVGFSENADPKFVAGLCLEATQRFGFPCEIVNEDGLTVRKFKDRWPEYEVLFRGVVE